MTRDRSLDRRRLLLTAAGLGVAASAQAQGSQTGLSDKVWDQARAARRTYADQISRTDYYGVVDFSLPSYRPRFFIISGAEDQIVYASLTAHGEGSDPDGERAAIPTVFSNARGSLASSLGAYLTQERYLGMHGVSLRLKGLDSSNSNAERRYIVIHSADYVTRAAMRTQTPLGRSQGCFAVPLIDRNLIIDRLEDGALLYAGYDAR